MVDVRRLTGEDREAWEQLFRAYLQDFFTQADVRGQSGIDLRRAAGSAS